VERSTLADVAIDGSGLKVIIAGHRSRHLGAVVAANPGMAALELNLADPASIGLSTCNHDGFRNKSITDVLGKDPEICARGGVIRNSTHLNYCEIFLNGVARLLSKS
jgi:hypothetical protein